MTEIEAKFILRQADQVDEVVRVLTAHGYRVDRRATRPHHDRYFDTPDWAILRGGWAYRSRASEGVETLGLKSLGAARRDVFVREEIEQRLPEGEQAERGPLPAGPVQERVDALAERDQRRELFSVDSRRTIYGIVTPDDPPARIELDLDETRVEARKATRKAPGILDFTELELELESGVPETVETLARLLRDELGLTPARYSKFERGIQAAGLRLPDTFAELPLDLDKRDPVLDLLFAYLGQQLARLERQQPRAWEGIDPEGVHQMRVAIRRLRAILRAFRDVIGEARGRWFNNELRWLARQLGRARDADVLASGAGESKGGDAGRYERYIEREAADAYANLVTVLESQRYLALLDELETLIDGGPDKHALKKYGKLSIAECAKRFVGTALAKMLARGDAIEADSPARKLHKLRIQAKRFRYLLDFFSTVQKHRWQKAIRATKRLQHVLGEHQDAVTARKRLTEYASTIPDDAPDEMIRDAEHRIRHEQDRIDVCRRDFESAWAAFRRAMT